MSDGALQVAINYVVDDGQKVINVPSTPDGEKSHSVGAYEHHTVPVTDARDRAADLSLDVEGFALVHHDTRMENFYDSDEVERVYNREMEELIKRETGAKKIVVFDHTLRARDDEVRAEHKVREPVQRAHNDYTIASGPRRVRDWFGEDEAAPLLERRFAIINIWRSIDGAIETDPLAICDARSVKPDDLIRAERRAKERVGETYRLAYSPDQLWYYFPLMQRDEVMLIKSYESETDGTARFTPHTAFVDPTTLPDAKPRQSMETRVFAFF